MEMRKTVLYGVLAFCLVVLNSCLGDPATQLTMANQAGVVVTGYGPGKAIYTKGDVVVSSEDFQNANVENGECILFDYSIDYGVANNMGAGTDTSYTEAIIYENTISEVNRWNFYNTLTYCCKGRTVAFFPPGAFRLYQRQFVPVHGDKQSPGKPSGQFLFVL